MTDTVAAPDPVRPKIERTPSRPALRRRHLWLPVAAAAVLIVFTMVAAWIESPGPGSEDFLSPKNSGGDGSSRLAERLAGDGVEVSRYTEAGDSFFEAVSSGDATVFVPAPDYLNNAELSQLFEALDAPDVRLVFVDPSRRLLDPLGLAESGAARIAPKTVEPDDGCGLSEAADAGAASMLRQAYTTAKNSSDEIPGMDWGFCYANGLAAAGDADFSVVVAGAPDPFTDEYFDEAGNAELTSGLLGQHDSVLWLDKHTLAEEPPRTESPPPSGEYSPLPEPSSYPIDYPDQANTNPVYEAMPSWMWAMLLGVLALGIGMALWKGRRLGPPVTEPLPATVPAAETVHGRARLYRRAHAYDETLRALRAGALHRIQPLLGLSSQAGQEEVVAAVAARTGWPAEHITATLYSARPTNETELYDATRAVDALVSAVETANPQGRN